MSVKKTYGQIINEHRQQDLTLDDDVIEYRRRMEPTIMENVNQTVEKSKKHDLYKNKNFYVVLLKKVERIGQAPRTFVFARLSCPTPVYKQSVWKYNYQKDETEFLWAIPDMILYYHLYNNRAKYIQDKECEDLTKFVVLMESGELLKWVIKENGEKIDAVIKINQETIDA